MVRIKELYEQYVILMENTYVGETIGEKEEIVDDGREIYLKDLESVKNYYLNITVGSRTGMDLTQEEANTIKQILGSIIKKDHSKHNANVRELIKNYSFASGDILADYSREKLTRKIRSSWISNELIPKTEEEWEALENNKLYTYVVFSEFDISEEIHHFIDYYLYLKNNPNNVNNNRLKKLFRIKSYENLINALSEFDRILEIERKKTDGKATLKGETVIDFKDGYTIQKLDSNECRNEEGPHMGHCLRNYNYKDSDIYSLRDGENVPHVTIEVKNGTVHQTKGKGNAPVSDKYVPYIQSFLDKMNFKYNETIWKKYKFI